MEGVGKVDVMVVLSSSGEKVFRTDRSENTSTTKEKDASGGERDAVSSQLEENTVFSQSAGQNTGNGPLISFSCIIQIPGSSDHHSQCSDNDLVSPKQTLHLYLFYPLANLLHISDLHMPHSFFIPPALTLLFYAVPTRIMLP